LQNALKVRYVTSPLYTTMKRDLEASKYIMVQVCQVQLCEVEI
jgi:hypothetical protein